MCIQANLINLISHFGKIDTTSFPEPPLATLVAVWIRGTQLRCTPRLCHSSREQPSYNSSNLASSSSAIITTSLTSNSAVVDVVVHPSSIFPCSIPHNSFDSMLSGVGNQSSYAKHHYRSSIRDNESRRAKYDLHSSHME